jgi:hypothetical protein
MNYKIIIASIALILLAGTIVGNYAFAFQSCLSTNTKCMEHEKYWTTGNSLPPSGCPTPEFQFAQTQINSTLQDYQGLKSQYYQQWQNLNFSGRYNGTWDKFFNERVMKSPDVINLRATNAEFNGIFKYCWNISGNVSGKLGVTPGSIEHGTSLGNAVIPLNSPVIPSNSTVTPLEFQSITKVPMWVKNNAGWWASGEIDDSDFLLGIQYLASQNIINLAPGLSSSGTNSAQAIPFWVKGISQMWADGKMSNSDFVSSIQFLADRGAINTNSK